MGLCGSKVELFLVYQFEDEGKMFLACTSTGLIYLSFLISRSGKLDQ
jgi:hypothetical protein